jgi:catechol 2,3-dioxygenase-like lactoylglutathione lyase family enzyme
MTRLTAQQFQDVGGTEDWRVLGKGASAWFAASSHVAGAALVRRVMEGCSAVGHLPDVDLRATGVHVRTLSTAAGLTESDVEVARVVSATARGLGLDADPSAVRTLHLSIDAMDTGAVMPFWQATLGYEPFEGNLLLDPHRRHPGIWFRQMDEPRPFRNRIHVDVGWPYELARERVASALGRGGKIVHDPGVWHNTVADPEGNEVDVFPLSDGDAFTATPGLDDWRSMLDAGTQYPAEVERGTALIEEAARLADDAGVGLLIDLRPEGIGIWTGKDCWGLPGYEHVARNVQRTAREAGLVADLRQVRDLQIAIDARDVERVRSFWEAALGYRPLTDLVPDGAPSDLYDPYWINPPLMFQRIDPGLDPDHAARAEQRGRIRIDLFVPHDQAEARIAAAVAAGGRVLYDAEAPDWWALADPEGNELDITISVGRKGGGWPPKVVERRLGPQKTPIDAGCPSLRRTGGLR